MKNNLYIDGVHYLTAREAGDVLGYAPDYVSRLCREGKLRGRRSGKTWIVEADSLVPFIKEHEAKKEAWHQNLSRELKSVAEPVIVRDKNFAPLSHLNVAPRQLHILRASEKAHATREKAQTLMITRITISSVFAVLLLFIANTTALSTPIANMLRGSASEQVAAASFFSPIESIARTSYRSVTSIACSITGWCDDVQPMPVVYVRAPQQPVAQNPAPTQITNNITNYIQPTVGGGSVLASGVSEQLLDSRLNAMENYLTGQIDLAMYEGRRQTEDLADDLANGIGGGGFDNIDITDSSWSGGSISGASISGSTLSGITFSGAQAFDALEVDDATTTNATSTNMYVSGSFGFGTGTGLVQTVDGIASTLANGGNGQVLKMVGGNLAWSTDLTGGGGGGASFFASTTDDLAIYPADPTDVLIIGNSATTTVGNILEIAGNSLFRGAMTSYGNVTAPRFTATSSTASVFPYASTTAISTNSLCIAGDCRQAWPTDSAFSTTSADYWKTQRDFFSTTSLDYYKSVNNFFSTSSADYWKTANNFFSTTSADAWKDQRNFFSTTSASYFLSQNQGNAFSTTSAQYFLTQNGSLGFSTTSNDYWLTQRNFFSTTSNDYWKTQNNFFSTTSADYYKSVNNFFSTSSANYFLSQNQGAAFSTTSADYLLSTYNKGFFFSTTSAAYFLTQNGSLGFSTTSNDYWMAQRNFFSTTSADAWKDQRNFFSTSSASYFASVGLAFSTTSNDYWRSVSNFFSTSSADYYKSVNNFFATTSADYWQATKNFFSTTSASYFLSQNQGAAFSTTSANYWETQQTSRTADDLTNNSIEDLSDVAAMTENYGDLLYWNGSAWADIATSSLGLIDVTFSTTSADYLLSTYSKGFFFSTTSADAWKDQRNFFSTTSAAYFSAAGLAWSTTSANYFLTQNGALGFSTTSANYFVSSSTTLPKTYSANTFTALQTFSNASSSIFSANTICLSNDCRTSWPTGIAYSFSLSGNATSTLTQFNGGLTAYASSTIGNGTAAGGLTVNGTATTSRLVVNSTATSTFAGDILMGGSIIPSADNTYSLGSESRMWKDVYIGPGSLYVNGKKVIEDVSNTITISTDNDQNLMSETSGVGNNTMRATGSGNMNLLSNSGNINVTSTSGNINIGTSGSGQLNLGIIASGTWQGTTIADAYLTKSGNWTGTLDGYEAAQLLGSGFSTSSADYWKTQRDFFSTTSASYFLAQNQGNAFSTTSADAWKDQRNFFSTTSASYFSSLGLAWSTTSANYYLSQNSALGFSTTSSDYWMSQRNFFSTTSANYWKSVNDFFSTTSADYWQTTKNFFSTTSVAYFLSQNQGAAFSTTSANYWETQQTSRSADDLSNNSIEDLSDVAAMTENYGDLLFWNGSSWTDIATSSLGLVTSGNLGAYLTLAAWYATTTADLAEGGSNLYYQDSRVQTYLDTIGKGYFFSTTSADAWKDQRNFFSTTSADYWKLTQDFFSTTSAQYFLSVTDLFSTTSANYFVHSSTTIPKTYTNNTFTALQQLNGGASTTQFTTTGSTYLAMNGGNVGIGTTTPLAQLSVHRAANGGTNPLFTLASSTAGATTTLFSINNAGAVSMASNNSFGVTLVSNSSADLLEVNNRTNSGRARIFASGFELASGGSGTFNSTALSLHNTQQIRWSASSNAVDGSQDIGLRRVSAGMLGVTNGTTGGGALSADYFTATSTSVSTFPTLLSTNATTTRLGITGIPSALLATDANGTVYATTSIASSLLNTSGNWTGTFDGQEGSYYLANSFSTTSADYWKTQRDFFSTTSASYFSSLGLAFSTTSADAWKDQRNFFSTTSASYFSSIGLAFSTTSNDYWKSVNNFFSTTSATYFVHSSTTIPKTYTANTYTGLQTFSNASTTLFSSAYASSTVGYFGSLNLGAALSVPNGGTGSTTLTGLLKGNGTGAVLTAVPGTDYIATTAGDWTGTFDGLEGSYYLANSFSTTSANYWSSLGLGFSTTSANYWQTTRDFFSTTSAIYLAHSSTTIPKTYSANTFTALQTFANASSTLFSSSYASSTNAFFGSTTVSGNVTARDYLFSETSASAQKRFSVTRAVPTTINDTISIASTTITNGAHNLYISITVPASSFSVSKQYALPLKYAQTSGAWQLALPISDTGSYVGNDFALDVRITNQVADFRIRRTLGSTVGTATINIEQLGAASTFTFSSFTESVSAPTAALGSTAFTQANGVASTSALVVSGQTTLSGNLSGVLKAANGVVSVATPGTDYQNFAYPFPSNATSTLLGFNGGLTAYASSTIGDGTQTGGLTISGGATTTGSLYVASNVGIGVASPSGKLEIGGTEGADEARLIFGASDGSNRYTFETDLDSSTSNDFLGLRTASTDNAFVVRGNGNVGISTSTPGSLFSIGNTNGINFSTATSTFSSTGGINLSGGCYAINGTCIGGGSASLSGTQGQLAYFSGTNTAIGTSSLFIDTNGRVGVGTTTPVAKFNVWGDMEIGAGGTTNLRAYNSSRNANGFLTLYDGTNGNVAIGTTFGTGDVILSPGTNGFVGIGTTTPIAALTVFGDTLFNGTDRYANFGTTTGSSGYGFRDNGGVIEFKNAGGTWQGVTTATTGPSFSVHKNGSDQTIAAGGATLLTWSTETFDTNNNFASNRFTPTVPGKYLIRAQAWWANTIDAGGNASIMIYKNGAVVAQVYNYPDVAAAQRLTSSISEIIDMNGSTDYVEIYVSHATAGSEVVDGTAILTNFSGAMIAPVNGNNAAGWANDGTQSFLLDNADKVGIGTTTPWAKLALQGDAGQTNPVFEIASSSTATKFLSVSGTGFGTTTLSGLNISGSATSTSNVGMNITSGCYAVNGTCVGGGSASLTGTTGQVAYFSGTNTAIGTSSLFIATNGNIGIGTTTPVACTGCSARSLAIEGDNASLRLNDTTGTAGDWLAFANNGSFTLSDNRAKSTRLLVNSNGDMGLGTSTPNAKLTVFGDTLFNGTDRYTNFGTTTGTDGYGFRDNGGVIEFKNAGGTWQGVTTATTGPSFHVSKTADQTNVGASPTLITWDVESFDTNNNFSGNRFMPTVPGKYILTANLQYGALSADDHGFAMIYKNGVAAANAILPSETAEASTVNVVITTIVEANGTTDYFEVYGDTQTASNQIVDGGNTAITYFTGAMIAPVNGNNAAGWANDGTQSFLLDNADKVGIGTTTPWAKLALQGDAGQTNPVFEIASSSTATKFLSVSATGFGTTTLSGLNISGSATSTSNVGMNITSGCYAVGGVCLSSGSSFAYPFLLNGNATSTLTQFNGGLTAYASSTIGAGGQATGLTINGGATTTGNAYFGGNVGIGTTSPGSVFSIGSIANFQAGTSTLYQNLNVQGQLKVGTNSIYLNGSGTSTFSNGIDLAGGCFSILNTCVLSANTSGLVAGDLTTAINTSVNALQIASSSAKWVSLSNGVADSFGSASIADDSGIDLVNSSGIATSAGMIALVPDAAPSGGSSSSSGGDSIRTFTSNGTFYSGAVGTVQVLVVGGGGGGGGNATASVRGSGGGGAGEYVAISSFNVTPATSYAITVGTGGGSNTDGATTTAFGLTARGGGAGAEPFNNGRPGGSGGGAGDDSSATTGGASTAVSPGVGSSGGNAGSGGSGGGGAGGGGAAGAGGSGGGNGVEAGGAGGTGIANTISGTSVTYSSGGAGGTRSGNNNGTNGATPGSGGRGAGGGASTVVTGGTGADGIVIVRYTTVSGTGASRLISNTFTASSSPSTAKFFFAGTSTAAFTLNTHIAAAVSRDGGTTWSTTTLQALSTLEDGSTLYGDTAVDLSGQPSGTSMKYRILMSPSSPAGIMLRGVSLQWGEVSAQNAGALSVTGSLSAQSLSLTSALGVANGGTGLTSISSGSILFGNDTGSIGTSSSLFWDTTNQRLGIGTTTPTYMLSVSGNGTNAKNRIAVWGRQNTTNGTAAGLSFFNTDGNPSTQKEIAGIDAGRHSNNFGGSLSLFTSDTAGATSTRLFIDSSGNVGIGTTTPLRQLHVSGTNAYVRLDGSANSGMEIYESGARKWIIDNLVSDDRLRFFSDTANEIMSLTQSGNVGVGTTTPVSTLSVQGSLCVRSTGSCGTTAGTIYATTATISDIDLAENYRAIDSTLLTGEIVSLLENSTSTIRRAKHGEEGLGVLSTKPGLLLGQEIKDGRAVALKGRVPLKVNMEGGPIAVGDRLTISSVPGIGTKATTSSYTVARALEATSVSGEIEVFVENEYTLVIEEKNALRDLLNATSTATSTPVFANIFARMTNWLADAQNGITEIFTKTLRAENVYADTVNANRLCLDGLCITKAELQQLLQGQSVAPSASGGSENEPDEEPDTPQTPAEEPTEETPENAAEEPPTEASDAPESAPDESTEQSEMTPDTVSPSEG